MVQAGNNGYALVRDVDFQHFYKHPLVTALASKSFNSSKPTSAVDHMNGLRLLKLRLQAKNLEDFKTSLAGSINDTPAGQITLDLPTFHALQVVFQNLGLNIDSKLLLDIDTKKDIVTIKNFDSLSMEVKQWLLLAKYNDVNTLKNDMPFVDYSTQDFVAYAAGVDKAIDYYLDNPYALAEVGQSSAHDLVFLRQLNHPMSMHGDEGGNPKAKPEKFARITTYYKKHFYITNT